jgi:hypothetical protein
MITKMKLLTTIFLFIVSTFDVLAQLFTNGDAGFSALFGRESGSYSCAIIVDRSGLFSNGDNQNYAYVSLNSEGYVEFNSNPVIIPNGYPSIYGCLHRYEEASGPYCAYMCNVNSLKPQVEGIDMSGVGNSKIVVMARASVPNSKLAIHIGYSNASFYPESTTYNVTNSVGGASISRSITLSNQMREYLIDFADNPTDLATWLTFAKRNQINVWGVDSQTPNVKYEIGSVKFGTSGIVTSVHTNSLNSNEYRLYPNPSQGTVFLILPSDGKVVSYQILNMQGEQVKKGEIHDSSEEISLENLMQGVYIVQVDGTKTIKLIKQ